MQFLSIIKKNFKFLSLTFFLFFVSCAVRAQDDLQQAVNSIIPTEKNSKIEEVLLPKTESIANDNAVKEQIKSPKKSTKKLLKKSNKKKKKIHKIIRKRIIKKVYVIKNDEVKKPLPVLDR